MITLMEEGRVDPSTLTGRKTETPTRKESRCCSNSRKDDYRVFCCRCLHKKRTSPLTCVTICVTVITYNFFGAFLFLNLEGTTTSGVDSAVAASKPNLSQIQNGQIRYKTVERLWTITEDLNILYKENWTKLAAKELMNFERVLVNTIKTSDITNSSHHNGTVDYHWTFASSFLYSLTLMTTIGHGSVTPKTPTGRMVAVAYACLGIPLIMLYLAIVGAVLARNFRALYSKLCPKRLKRRSFHSMINCRNRRSPSCVQCRQTIDKQEKLHERQKRTPFQAALNLDNFNGYHWTCRHHTRVPIFLSLLIIILYIAIGAVIFHATEQWNFIDGCYFSFSSLATIGFGNLKPGKHAGTISPKAQDIALGVCCIYILVGILVVAMCFNLIQEDIGAALKGFLSICSGLSKSRVVHSAEKSDEKISMALVS